MTPLEGRLRYQFANPALLEQAVRRAPGPEGYQRLEFLGDRVLGLLVGEWLYSRFPDADEGELSRRLTFLVRGDTLAKIAENLGLEAFVNLAGGEVLRPTMLADAVEAILGALWLDGGLAVAAEFVHREWLPLVDADDFKDAKTRLQEHLQAQKLPLPVYKVVEESGPPHDRVFRVKVTCGLGVAEGEGRTKQAAGIAAAEEVLGRLTVNG